MKIKKHDIIELEIETMAFGGQGIARVDGYVVFVKGGIPGDRLKARVFKKKRDFAEAGIVEMLETSPDRIKAPCPYSGYCGGCQWQQVQYEKQLEYKKGHVLESLAHIGSLENVPVKDVLPSETIFGYRNKMEFSFSDRRWFLPHELDLKETESGFALGLHVPRTFNKVIDMEACLLQKETGNHILGIVKEYARNSGVPVYGIKTHEGFWRYLAIRYSVAFDQWMVNLVTAEDRPDIVQPLADELAVRFERIGSIVNNITARKAAIAMGEEERVLFGESQIEDQIGSHTFRISANSFFQTNTPGARKLYETVLEYAELTGEEQVLDLYSGTGTIPIYLSSRAKNVIGMEIVESAIADARKNCEENGIQNCSFICGDIRKKLPEIEKTPDVLIIDPPRAGMHKDVLIRIMEMAPEKIVYVSCNPTTLARDLGQMEQDYEILEIQPVDMFPHTYHIEAVAKLRRK